MNLKIIMIGCSVFLLLIVASSDIWFYLPHPSDQTLTRSFHNREAELNKLIETGIEDVERRKAGRGETVFIAESYRERGQPWERNGTEKGYAYSGEALSPLLDSLDDVKAEKPGIAYRKIKDNWYLYYEVWESKPE